MTPALVLDNVTVHYGLVRVLDRVSLTVAAGARHAILGLNAAGKTTLLNVVAGLVTPTAGRVLLYGQDVTRRPAHHIARRGVAIMRQHSTLCATLTAFDNVLLACRGIPRPARRRYAQDLLRRAGLGDMASAAAATLSLGQRRRLELAIALAGRPRLLLLDEPAAGLDAAGVGALVNLLRQPAGDLTVVVVAHGHPTIECFATEHTTTTTTTIIIAGRVATPGTREPSPVASAAGVLPPESLRSRGSMAAPRLTVRHLSAGYATTTVIDGIDLDVEAGEVVAVKGPNGSGKTTLLRTLAGVHPAGDGSRIAVNGVPVQHLAAAPRARHGVALVPQRDGVFATLTVAANLRILNSDGETADEFTPFLDRLDPRCLAGSLSGGQQRMLALARAVRSRPPLLLLDEPFNGLDHAATHAAVQAIRRLLEGGAAVVIVDHRQVLSAQRSLILGPHPVV